MLMQTPSKHYYEILTYFDGLPVLIASSVVYPNALLVARPHIDDVVPLVSQQRYRTMLKSPRAVEKHLADRLWPTKKNFNTTSLFR